MARREDEGVITLSVLDRLLDREPKNRSEAPMTRAQSLRELRASLRRDLEWLLNTRRTPEPAPESCAQVSNSLFNYGLPDLTSFSLSSGDDQARLCKLLEECVRIFEPRLTSVQVALAPSQSAGRTLRFVIDALLRIDPAPEHITFDTTLELTSGEYAVKGEGAR